MTATFVLAVLIAMMILIRQVRWVAVVVLLVAIGYFAHNRMDYWPMDHWAHQERQDHTIILRP
jgi:hypothetical protein